MAYQDPKVNYGLVRLKVGYNMTASATEIDLEPGDGTYISNPATDGAFNLSLFRTNVDVNGAADANGFANAAADPNREIIRVTAKSSDTLTIVRGQEGTTASSHNETNARYLLIQGYTKKDRDDVENQLDAIDDELDGIARSKFLSYLSSAQAVGAGATATIEFDTLEFDENSDYINYSWVAPRDMWIWLYMQITWDSWEDQKQATLTIQKDGSSAVAINRQQGAHTSDFTQSIGRLFYVDSGGSFRGRVTSAAAGSHDILAASTLSYFCGWEVRKL